MSNFAISGKTARAFLLCSQGAVRKGAIGRGVITRRYRGQGAGFYVEAGIHLMIASRYSFIGNVFYRNLKMDNVWAVDESGNSLGPLLNDDGSLAEIDLSGIGLRVGINIDILDRF